MYPPTLASVMGAKGKVRTAEDEPDKSAAETTSSYKLQMTIRHEKNQMLTSSKYFKRVYADNG